MEDFIRVTNLQKTFDLSTSWLSRMSGGGERRHLKAVKDASFTIGRKETFALVGESGSGKSTLARMMVGLLAPTAGTVMINQAPVGDRAHAGHRRDRTHRIQMIFQHPQGSLNPRWRVASTIAEPIRAEGLLRGEAEIKAEVTRLLACVGLDASDGRKWPHQLSGGQSQRVAIARALASKPDFIVCDEPTSALDVSVQAQILNLMRDLQDEFGLTYLFISHDLAIVRHMATRIGVMYLGRIVEIAPAEALFQAPQHPYTRMLLDAVPDLDRTGRPRGPMEGEVPNPIAVPQGCAFHPRCPLANARCRMEEPKHFAVRGTIIACHAVEEDRTREDA